MSVKFKRYLFLFIGLSFFLFFLVNMRTEKDSNKEDKTLELCIRENCFVVGVAKTENERELGLMYKEELPQEKGLLLVFEDEGVQSIWMKNVLIPLDIIWINSDLEIVSIKENVSPCKKEPCLIYKNSTSALYVLELNAGKVKEIGTREGDRVSIQTKKSI